MPGTKLHICVVTGEFPALSETFITMKVLELRKRGHIVTVIKNQTQGQINYSHLDAVKQAGIQIMPFNVPGNLFYAALRKPIDLLRSLSFTPQKLKKNFKHRLQSHLLQKRHYDIIHFEFSGLAVSYAGVLQKLNPALVVSCRGTAEKVKILTQPDRAEKLQKVFERADAIHCVSQDMADTIKPYCASQKIFVNRPSIDTEVFKRKKPYQSHPKLQLLSIGRFTFQKGYLMGLLAANELRAKGVDFEWTIVGEGPQFEEMQYHIHAMQLTGNVKLAGKKNRDEIVSLYHNADIFFLPSVYEGIANVCLEAMAMEIPVVATRSGGMEEVIDHGTDGLLADVYNFRQMADRIYALYQDFDRRDFMGKKARNKIISCFSLKKQVDLFEEQYFRLANAKAQQTSN